MKRMGTFCDKKDTRLHRSPPCENIAIGACIACGEDICTAHGHPKGIELKLHRMVPNTSSQDLLVEGGVVLCFDCSSKLANQAHHLLRDQVLPALLATIAEDVKAALVAEALT